MIPLSLSLTLILPFWPNLPTKMMILMMILKFLMPRVTLPSSNPSSKWMVESSVLFSLLHVPYTLISYSDNVCTFITSLLCSAALFPTTWMLNLEKFIFLLLALKPLPPLSSSLTTSWVSQSHPVLHTSLAPTLLTSLPFIQILHFFQTQPDHLWLLIAYFTILTFITA